MASSRLRAPVLRIAGREVVADGAGREVQTPRYPGHRLALGGESEDA
ncbi:predicted protein [Streptomyces sp. SPB78]|nr:predicted protein [Streptomyces sp. SPB78]